MLRAVVVAAVEPAAVTGPRAAAMVPRAAVTGPRAAAMVPRAAVTAPRVTAPSKTALADLIQLRVSTQATAAIWMPGTLFKSE